MGDGLVLFLFILLATSSFWLGGLARTPSGAHANLVAAVTLSNKLVTTVDLQKPADWALQAPLGEVVLRVADNRIRVLQSPCPNQVCVRQGAVHRPGEMLVCVPNRLVIFIRGEEDAGVTTMPGDSTIMSATKEFAPKRPFDAVTY
jgi:hypothetical protein